ncbi:TPA: hypothetical protein EYP13_00340 [Candidatus Micrarchaeota archaeon]|nr:hypothetical protein [Candidatus Micrarchaeota archaeon]
MLRGEHRPLRTRPETPGGGADRGHLRDLSLPGGCRLLGLFSRASGTGVHRLTSLICRGGVSHLGREARTLPRPRTHLPRSPAPPRRRSPRSPASGARPPLPHPSPPSSPYSPFPRPSS